MKNTSIYHLDGVPPLKQAIPLGLQHILAMFVSNITPIIIVANVLGISHEVTTGLIQATMLVAGINTLIQAYTLGPIGAKLPVVVGTSFAFVPIAISIGLKYGFEAVLGAALIGGIFEACLGLVIKKIRNFFPTVVTGVIVLSIGLTLIPVGIQNLGGGFNAPDYGSAKNLLVGGSVLVIVIALKHFGKGLISTGSAFIATVIGFFIALSLGMVDVAPINKAELFSIPRPFTFGFKFHLDAIVSMIILYTVSAIETLGDMTGVTLGGAGRETTDKELSGGILADGIGGVIAAGFSILPTTTFSQNSGIVMLTGIMSRFIIGVGAIFLIIAAFFPKLGAALTVIPPAVLGGSLVIMFAMITISGINLITKEPLKGRNALIVAVSLGLGYGLGLVPDTLKFLPETIKLIFGGSGIVISSITAVVLNLILPNYENIKEECVC